MGCGRNPGTLLGRILKWCAGEPNLVRQEIEANLRYSSYLTDAGRFQPGPDRFRSALQYVAEAERLCQASGLEDPVVTETEQLCHGSSQEDPIVTEAEQRCHATRREDHILYNRILRRHGECLSELSLQDGGVMIV